MISQPQTQPVPKCLHCGFIGPWQVEPIFIGRHLLIGGLLILLAGSGLLYFLAIGLMRMDAKNRPKICAQCKARNMFTFQF